MSTDYARCVAVRRPATPVQMGMRQLDPVCAKCSRSDPATGQYHSLILAYLLDGHCPNFRERPCAAPAVVVL